MRDNKRKILALTGIRSEYDLMYPLLSAIHNDEEFDLGMIVTGAHLTALHNYSVRLIEQDGFSITERIENLLYSSSLLGKAKSASILMQGLTQVLERENPDFLLILGDREECIIGSITAGYMNIPVIHLAGGDHTFPEGGDIDEQIRHATTKLSHVHLTMTEEHSERIIRLGEEPDRVHTVGSGGIDRLRTEPELSLEQLADRVQTTAVMEDFIILIHHSLSSNIQFAATEMRLCLQACLESGLNVFVGSPNSDPGYQDIIEVINEYKQHDQINTYHNLDRITFVNLLRNAKCLVGNSSLGIHEAPYLCLPTINVGERQRGRRAGANVQYVPANIEEIRKGIHKALHDEAYIKSLEKDRFIYGDGYMSKQSLEIIKSLPNKEKLLAKKLTY